MKKISDFISSLKFKKNQKYLDNRMLTHSDIDNIIYIKNSLHLLYTEYLDLIEVPYNELLEIYERYIHKYSRLQQEVICGKKVTDMIDDLDKINYHYYRSFIKYMDDVNQIKTYVLPESPLLHSIQKEVDQIQALLDRNNELIANCRHMVMDLNVLNYDLDKYCPPIKHEDYFKKYYVDEIPHENKEEDKKEGE